MLKNLNQTYITVFGHLGYLCAAENIYISDGSISWCWLIIHIFLLHSKSLAPVAYFTNMV